MSCYQIIGVPEKAEKDQIVKSVMDLKNAEVEDRYSVEAVVSRQAGEEKLVLEIGRVTLLYADTEPHAHDVLLSMVLAGCAIAKTHLEKNKVFQVFEALARAQCLLRSKISLDKMKLLLEIEVSLEELASACTLELLAMPQTTDNAERRCGAMAALLELLRQGLDVEASC